MLGAVAGDIIGSPYEWNNTQDRYFELCRGTRGWFRGREVTFHPRFTDDTVMTLAVARWLMNDSDRNASNLIRIMQSMGREYIDRGFAPMFKRWIESDNQEQLADFKRRKHTNMAVDKHGRDVFLADTSYALALAQENFKDIRFHFTSEF